MFRLGILISTVLLMVSGVTAQDCASIAKDMKLPKSLKTRGKPKIGKWEDVDKMLAELAERMNGLDCSLNFGEVFIPKGDDVYFPLSNSLIRVAPEGVLDGLEVITKEGESLGTYVGRVRYERSGGLYARSSYSLYFFQFRTESDRIESVRNRLLLGDFAVPWSGVKDKVLIQLKDGQEP